mgnify:CR=1 FL=1
MQYNEEDVYGDEIDADEDKNDGLNALVISHINHLLIIESPMGYRYK